MSSKSRSGLSWTQLSLRKSVPDKKEVSWRVYCFEYNRGTSSDHQSHRALFVERDPNKTGDLICLTRETGKDDRYKVEVKAKCDPRLGVDRPDVKTHVGHTFNYDYKEFLEICREEAPAIGKTDEKNPCLCKEWTAESMYALTSRTWKDGAIIMYPAMESDNPDMRVIDQYSEHLGHW